MDVEEEVFGQGNLEEETTPPEKQASEAPDEGGTILAGPGSEETEPKEEQETETPAENAEEEREAREQLYQTKYQELLNTVKEFDSDAYAAWSDKTGDEATKTEASAASEVEGSLDEMAAMEKRIMDGMRNELRTQREQDHRSQIQSTYQRELHVAKGALDKFIADAEISKEAVDQAGVVVQGWGIDPNVPGGPSQYLKAMGYVLGEHVRNSARNSTTEQAAAEAKAKTEALAGVQQPKGGASPEPPKKSKEQRLLDAMNATAEPAVSAEVFGPGNS